MKQIREIPTEFEKALILKDLEVLRKEYGLKRREVTILKKLKRC